MEIKILKQMESTPKLNGWVNKGLTIEEIQDLETLYNQGNLFPTALREFLFLAGNFPNIGFGLHDNIWRLQQRAREGLADYELEITRPFFAFDHLDSCSSFTLVYLDENQEDPDVYTATPYLIEDFGEPFINRYKDYTFSSLVNEHIYRIKRGYALD
ncbi:MAG: hypothetical protein R2798_02165 [Chitinophagales bacterium]|nr:hypothetical protein [Bacteroidota bacterium]